LETSDFYIFFPSISRSLLNLLVIYLVFTYVCLIFQMTENKTAEASASIASIPVPISSVSPINHESQDIELAPVNLIAAVQPEEDASRSKFRIVAIMTALYVSPPSQHHPHSLPQSLQEHASLHYRILALNVHNGPRPNNRRNRHTYHNARPLQLLRLRLDRRRLSPLQRRSRTHLGQTVRHLRSETDNLDSGWHFLRF